MGNFTVLDSSGRIKSVGAAVTNASLLTSGTVADARLSSKVPLDDVAEAISGVWAFTNGLTERGRAVAMGVWQNQAFDATHFTGSASMTWTVDSTAMNLNTYALIGKTLFWSFYILWFAGTSTVGGTPNTTLNLRLPGGFNHGGFTQSQVIAYVVDAGVVQRGIAELSGVNLIDLGKADGTAWTAGTVGMIGTVTIAIA